VPVKSNIIIADGLIRQRQKKIKRLCYKTADDGKRQTNHHQVGHSGENNKKDEVNANSDRCVLCDSDR
jgi:hypothetical protein